MRSSRPRGLSVLALLCIPVMSGAADESAVDAFGISLFGASASEIPDFFARNRCLAGTVTNIEDVDGQLMATVVYPSTNYGFHDQPTTVLYSHGIEILDPGAGIDLAGVALILCAEGASEFVYRVAGVVSLEEIGGELAWDFFADKPELWYQETNASR